MCPDGASHAARPSAFQHASGLPLPHNTPLPSWDHMFLCNGFCCSPPPLRRRVLLFFVHEVHAPALLFHLLLGYHSQTNVSIFGPIVTSNFSFELGLTVAATRRRQRGAVCRLNTNVIPFKFMSRCYFVIS